MRRLSFALALFAAGAWSASALANGRFPSSMSVSFHPTDPQRIYVGTTFGLLISQDDGATWRWTCEQSIGYGGDYDPVYLVTASGAILATTFSGLRVSRDGGCTWTLVGAPIGPLEVSDLALGADGAIWAATAEGGQMNDVFVSRDDGMTFQSVGLAAQRVWWRSVEVAPSDPMRVYVTGYELTEAGSGTIPLLYRSDDGGQSWTEIPVRLHTDPILLLVGVSPADEDLVFARIDGPLNDTLVRSTDGGLTWSYALSVNDKLWAFAARADGQTVIAGTVNQGVKISMDGGATWAPAQQEPRMACVGERSDGVLFACGANWNPDKFALGRSTDGQTWQKVFRFIEIDGQLACGGGTGHAAECAALWEVTACQFGIGKPDAGPIPGRDAGAGGDGGPGGDEGGGGDCGCRMGGRGAAWTGLALIAISGIVAVRREAGRGARRRSR